MRHNNNQHTQEERLKTSIFYFIFFFALYVSLFIYNFYETVSFGLVRLCILEISNQQAGQISALVTELWNQWKKLTQLKLIQ